MNEAKGIAFTDFQYKGFKISVTCRDGGKKEAEESMLAIMDILNEYVIPDMNVPEIPFDEPDPFDDKPTNPAEYGLVDKFPAAGDWNPGDEYEMLVTQYRIKDGALEFYKDDYEYPVHKHFLNEYGSQKMAELFVPDWDKHFNATEQSPIVGGDLIIKVVGSEKRRESGSGRGNVFRNLEGQRRP